MRFLAKFKHFILGPDDYPVPAVYLYNYNTHTWYRPAGPILLDYNGSLNIVNDIDIDHVRNQPNVRAALDGLAEYDKFNLLNDAEDRRLRDLYDPHPHGDGY